MLSALLKLNGDAIHRKSLAFLPPIFIVHLTLHPPSNYRSTILDMYLDSD